MLGSFACRASSALPGGLPAGRKFVAQRDRQTADRKKTQRLGLWVIGQRLSPNMQELPSEAGQSEPFGSSRSTMRPWPSRGMQGAHDGAPWVLVDFRFQVERLYHRSSVLSSQARTYPR